MNNNTTTTTNINTNNNTNNNNSYIAACENLHKTYLIGLEGVPALRGINLEIKHGEFLMIFGTSGGGKSSLLNIIGTIDLPTKGNLMILNKRITENTPDGELARYRCHHIGFVFQSFNLLSTMTAVGNVALPLLLSGKRSRNYINKRALKLLKDVGLEHRSRYYPAMLSGGEQQRVTIARALSNKPELLLLDEPTGDLDSKNGDMVMKILLELNRGSNSNYNNNNNSNSENNNSNSENNNLNSENGENNNNNNNNNNNCYEDETSEESDDEEEEEEKNSENNNNNENEISDRSPTNNTDNINNNNNNLNNNNNNNKIKRKKKRKPLTMIMVTHDTYMKKYADRVIYIRDGKISNIEIIPTNIKDKARSDLINNINNNNQDGDLQNNNVNNNKSRVIYKNNNEYITHIAQKDFNHSSDIEMMKAVRVLFGVGVE